jgi:hypothetical protein
VLDIGRKSEDGGREAIKEQMFSGKSYLGMGRIKYERQ